MNLLLVLFYAAGAAAIARTVMLGRRGRVGRTGPLQDVYEAAFLSGGPGRVADTALATMHVDGRLAIGGPGVVAVVRAVAHDPVERAVLDVHAAAPSGALHHLRLGVMTHPAVQEIGDGLAARGLLVLPERRRAVRRWCVGTALAAVLMVPVAVVVTVVQFTDPEGAMIPFVVLVLPLFFACLLTAIICGSAYGRQLGSAGQTALAAFRRSYGLGSSGTAHAVALGGIRALPDPELRERLRNASRLQGSSPSGGGRRASSSHHSSDPSHTTAFAAVVVWCAGAAPGGGDGWVPDSGSGSGSSCGSGGSSCSSSSSCGSSSCGSSSSSSCGGGGGGGCGGGGG
ncbi:TIGR04222 domain-containing membrane protein [Streptomyces sp. NPDC004435]|uniref:TIGR04222 domain-containing membrane protein n=1 Tax=Streptomyces sp. NPDC004435 TaxID=3364701 RepID=UPI0036B9B2AD